MKKEHSNRAVITTAIVMAILIVAVVIFVCICLFVDWSSTGTTDLNANGSTEEEDSSADGSDDNGIGSQTPVARELDETDIENLAGALTTVRLYNGSYYATSYEVITDNLTSETQTDATSIAFDQDDSKLFLTEDYADSEKDYADAMYIIVESGISQEECDGCLYESYTDNLDDSNSYKVDISVYFSSIGYTLYDIYADDFVSSMFSITAEDVIATYDDVENFMQNYLYFQGVATENEIETTGHNYTEDGVEIVPLSDGTGTIVAYDDETTGGVIYQYSYTDTVTCCDEDGNEYIIHYTSTTSILVVDGWITERATQEELTLSDASFANTYYDTSYTNDVTMEHSCDASLFDVDFTDYVAAAE